MGSKGKTQKVARWKSWILVGWMAVLGVPGPLARTLAQTPDGGSESHGQPTGNGESGLRITLRIFNYAHVTPPELTRAEQVAAAIFRKAGIETMWIDCPVSREEVDRFPACQRPWATSDFALRFVSQPFGERPGSHHDLGWALPCVDGQQGCYTYVFYQLARQWAERCDTTTDQILGHAIAHEVGHLLLGPDSHSQTGVMRGDWSMDDLAAMARTFLCFTPTQCERLQSDVSARMRDHADTLASRGL